MTDRPKVLAWRILAAGELEMGKTSRRAFLDTISWTLGSLAVSRGDEPARPFLEGLPRDRRRGGPRVAAIVTAYHYLSHAYHIVGRLLDGYTVAGRGFHEPRVNVVSLFIEQTPDNDLGRAKARDFGVRLSPTIADALTMGTGRLDVDAVLLIGEHGEYPYNSKLQKLYPRFELLEQVSRVFESSKRSVPVFIDKHLSYDRDKAMRMVKMAEQLKFPLMAGSSLPVTWRLPELEPPLGKTWSEAIVASRGEIEIFGFHALETLQCMVERRDRKGATQGVKAVTCLEGDAVWEAADRGDWSWDLLDNALSRSHTLNPGSIRQNTRDFAPPPGRPTFLRGPIAFQVDYRDGLRATALLLNGHVDDTTFAGRYADPETRLVSSLFYLPAPPGASFFTPLALRIEDFFLSGKPPYPVERSLLTGGILDAALESRSRGHARVETPDLAMIDYEAPTDSGFIRGPVATP